MTRLQFAKKGIEGGQCMVAGIDVAPWELHTWQTDYG
mgnify:CR=1 FL=1